MGVFSLCLPLLGKDPTSETGEVIGPGPEGEGGGSRSARGGPGGGTPPLKDGWRTRVGNAPVFLRVSNVSTVRL